MKTSLNQEIKTYTERCITLQQEIVEIAKNSYALATQRDYLKEQQKHYANACLELGSVLMDWLLSEPDEKNENFIYHPNFLHLSSYQSHVQLNELFDVQEELKKNQQKLSIQELDETGKVLVQSQMMIATLNQEINGILEQLQLGSSTPEIKPIQADEISDEEAFVQQVLHEDISEHIDFIDEESQVIDEESQYTNNIDDDFLIEPDQDINDDDEQEIYESYDEIDKILAPDLVAEMVKQLESIPPKIKEQPSLESIQVQEIKDAIDEAKEMKIKKIKTQKPKKQKNSNKKKRNQ